MGILRAAKHQANIHSRNVINKLLSLRGMAYPYLDVVQIEPTKLCNMSCQMCMNPYLSSSEKGNMSYDNFLKIINQFPRTKNIILQGLGEIFLNKDIFKMLTYLKENGHYVQFATNCSLLTERDMKNIAELGIDEIRLSIDTLNPTLYEEIRGVNSFNRVIKNIQNLAHIVKYESLLMINMVVSQDNISEVTDMIGFASANNIKIVRVSWIQQKGVKDQRKFVSERMLPTMNLSEIRKESIEKGVKLHVNIPNKIHALNCKSIYNTAYITWDGFVTPCCHLENPKVINFGNVLETPFNEIWNGKKYRAFRKGHFDINSACVNCPHYSQE